MVKTMNKFTKAELDKLTEKEIGERVINNLFSISISLNQIKTLSKRNKNKDTADTIHASLDKTKLIIDSVMEDIDFRF